MCIVTDPAKSQRGGLVHGDGVPSKTDDFPAPPPPLVSILSRPKKDQGVRPSTKKVVRFVLAASPSNSNGADSGCVIKRSEVITTSKQSMETSDAPPSFRPVGKTLHVPSLRSIAAYVFYVLFHGSSPSSSEEYRGVVFDREWLRDGFCIPALMSFSYIMFYLISLLPVKFTTSGPSDYAKKKINCTKRENSIRDCNDNEGLEFEALELRILNAALTETCSAKHDITTEGATTESTEPYSLEDYANLIAAEAPTLKIKQVNQPYVLRLQSQLCIALHSIDQLTWSPAQGGGGGIPDKFSVEQGCQESSNNKTEGLKSEALELRILNAALAETHSAKHDITAEAPTIESTEPYSLEDYAKLIAAEAPTDKARVNQPYVLHLQSQLCIALHSIDQLTWSPAQGGARTTRSA